MAETKDEIKKRLYKSIIIQSILKDIDDSYKNDILGGCIILIFCAVSTMAFLSTPKDHEEVTGRDFKGWVEKYLSSGEDQSYNYDPIDMWAARCGILHRYSPTSKYTDKKRAKKFTYNMSQNHVIKDSNTVSLSIPRFKDDLKKAVAAFFEDAAKNPGLRKNIDHKIVHLFHIKR